MDEEEWRDIPGHEGVYQASSKGRIRSLDRVQRYTRIDQYSGRDIVVERKHAGRVLRPGRVQSGHLSVVLGHGKHGSLVHRLVLTTFVGPCPDGLECLHRDGNPANNAASNLRWGSRSENLLDAVKHGAKPVGERHHNAKLTAEQVLSIRSSTYTNGFFARSATRFGVSECVIRAVYYGRSWKSIKGGVSAG
jgi:hypothetical protein